MLKRLWTILLYSLLLAIPFVILAIVIFLVLAQPEEKQPANKITQPATEKSLFILDMEMLEGGINEGRWVLTYALEGKPYVVVFRDNKAGQDFIQYLQENHTLWQKE